MFKLLTVFYQKGISVVTTWFSFLSLIMSSFNFFLISFLLSMYAHLPNMYHFTLSWWKLWQIFKWNLSHNWDVCGRPMCFPLRSFANTRRLLCLNLEAATLKIPVFLSHGACVYVMCVCVVMLDRGGPVPRPAVLAACPYSSQRWCPGPACTGPSLRNILASLIVLKTSDDAIPIPQALC